MRISTKGRYALRMFLDLAEHRDEGMVALIEVANRQGISKKYLEQILPVFARSDLLRTNRGAKGGYRLAKDPKEIRVGEILRMTEGELTPVDCAVQDPVECVRCDRCLTLPLWRGLYRTINDYLDSVTLQDLLDQTLSGEPRP